MQDVHAGRDIIFGTKPLFERIYDRFAASLGLWGQIAVGVLILVWLCLWFWQHIEQMPLIDAMVSWFNTQVVELWPLPKAKPEFFTVAVARLENDDEKGDMESTISQDLRDLKKSNGIAVLEFHRTITADSDDDVCAGQAIAQKWLKKSGAQVLVWGKVLTVPGRPSVPELCWTNSENAKEKKESDRYPLQEDLTPPIGFNNDLSDILHLVAVTQSAAFYAEEGHFVADRLRPFIERVRHLLKSDAAKNWKPKDIARTKLILANALTTVGEQAGDNDALSKAIDLYNETFTVFTRQQYSLQWAMIQNNLGTALMDLGELEQAVVAYKAALGECPLERAPLQWAMIQLNLGAALGKLGSHETGTKDLEEAVAANREALKEYTRERTPLDWANIQLNMGAALSDLGQRETGTNDLKQAVNADQETLKEYTRERTPLDWANIQLNMGGALRRLGEREAGTNDLKQAVNADREALTEYTRERTPVNWAITQNNLGLALATLGEREAGTNHLEAGTNHLKEAVEHYRDALEVFTREQDPERWAITQYNLGAALRLLGDREPGTDDLEQAVVRCSAALEVLTREQDPERWAEAQNDLGDAQRDLAERTNDAHLLCAALQGHLNAWEVSAGAAPYNASIAAKGAREDVAKLRERLAPAVFHGCTTQYAQTLKQMGLQ
jgi:tetratricopeptide (TPR) repeat protein